MRLLKEQDKRDSLNEVLIELSKSQDILQEPRGRASFFIRLESIYYNCDEENFRHFYSDIFSALTLIAAVRILPRKVFIPSCRSSRQRLPG